MHVKQPTRNKAHVATKEQTNPSKNSNTQVSKNHLVKGKQEAAEHNEDAIAKVVHEGGNKCTRAEHSHEERKSVESHIRECVNQQEVEGVYSQSQTARFKSGSVRCLGNEKCQ